MGLGPSFCQDLSLQFHPEPACPDGCGGPSEVGSVGWVGKAFCLGHETSGGTRGPYWV